MSGPSARYSSFRVPVETGTPPRRRGSRDTSPKGCHFRACLSAQSLTSLLLSKRDPLTLGSRLAERGVIHGGKAAANNRFEFCPALSR